MVDVAGTRARFGDPPERSGRDFCVSPCRPSIHQHDRKRTWINAALLAALVLAVGSSAVFAGDTIYGRGVAVARNDVLVTVESHGRTRHEVRIVAIVLDPHRPGLAAEAQTFVEGLVGRKYVRLRIIRRVKDQLVGKLLVEDPADGIQDVGIRMLEEGYAKRLPAFDYVYKYGESIAAEDVAKKRKLRIWSPR